MTAQTMPKHVGNGNEYRKEWIRRKRRANPEFARKQSEAARAWQKANPIRHARNQYRKSARIRQLAWELTDAQVDRLVNDVCFYCGLPPGNGIHGIDRFDNAQGYRLENCVTACAQCNRAKRDYTSEEFVAWARRLVEYQERRHG